MYLEIFLADFAVFRVFLGISQDFASPRLREISEALSLVSTYVKHQNVPSQSPIIGTLSGPMTTYWDDGFNIHLTSVSYNLMNGLIYTLTFMVHHATQSLGRTLSATIEPHI